MTEERQRAPKPHPLYIGLLGASPLLLGVIGWFSIRTVDAMESTVHELVGSMGEVKGDVRELKVTMDNWAKQGFVSRDLFDALRAEMERRVGAIEKAGGK